MPLDARGFNLVSNAQPLAGGIGSILTQNIVQDLASKAMSGDQQALADLAVKDPRASQRIGSILQDQDALKEQDRKIYQDMAFRVARGFKTAKDKAGYLAAAAQQLEAAGLSDMAKDVMEDAETYATDPQRVEQEYESGYAMFDPSSAADSKAQYGAQVTVKDEKGNLYFSTQERDPSTKQVKTVLSPVGNSPANPIGQVQVVGSYGLTADERVNQVGNEATAGERAKQNETQRQAIIQQGNSARSMIPKTKKLIELNQLISTGKTAKARKFFGDLFGVTDPDLGQFNAMAGKLVLDNIRALGANPTEGERAFLMEISPSLEQGGAVNEAILKDMLDIQERQVKRARWFANNPGKTLEEYFLMTDEEDFAPQSSPGSAQSNGPAVGTVDSGYKFKGGDPADPNNWEAVQ